MRYFFCKLNAPRKDFVQTMSPSEVELMQAHAVYWKGLLDRGLVAAFGLVGDPHAPYGIGILTIGDADDPGALTAADPTIVANVGFSYDILPMPRAVTRPHTA